MNAQSESLLFALLAAAIWATECFARVPMTTWCFTRDPRGTRATRGDRLPHWAGAGLDFLWPLPPFGFATLVPERPRPGRTNVEAIRKRVARIARATRLLVPLQSALFVVVAGTLATAAVIEIPLLAWPGIGITALVLHFGIGVAMLRARRALRKEVTIPRSAVALTFASPFASMRANDAFWRRAFDEEDPLAVARVLCDPDTFDQVARMTWFGTSEEARDERSRLLEKLGRPVEDLLAPPLRSDPQVRAYCPRCFEQFRIEGELCPDCEGIRTRPFD